MPDTVHRLAVCAVAALPIGDATTVTPPGRSAIAVFHTEDGLFAIDDTCTHQDTSLAEGWVENCTVECPLHESCFDLRTGIPSGVPATTPVRTFDVHVVDGMITVDLPTE